MPPPTVPYVRSTYGESYLSKITTQGIICLEGDAIVLEYRATTTRYDKLETTHSDVQTVSIPLAAVESLEAKVGFLRAWLLLRTRSLRALEALPDAVGNEYGLPVPWRDRARARELAVAVSLQLASRALRELEDGG